MAAYLLTGDDESVLRSAVQDLVHRLIGDGDRTLMVDEFDGEDYELRSIVDAAQTPPFLTETRIVVGPQHRAVHGRRARAARQLPVRPVAIDGARARQPAVDGSPSH